MILRQRPLGRIVGVVSVVLLLLVAADAARAGTYEVHACDSAAASASSSWKPSDSGGMLAYAACPSHRDSRRGLVVRNEVNGGTVARGEGAFIEFRAPEGAQLAGMTYDWDGYRVDGGWSVGIADGDSGRWLSGCRAGEPSFTASCRLGGSAPSRYLALDGRSSVRLEASCGRSGGCTTRSTGDAANDNARARLSVPFASVRVEDFSAPTIAELGGGLWNGGWHRGTVSAAYSTGDNVGIGSTYLAIDGAAQRDDGRQCEYTRRVPCANVPADSYSINTTGLSDGEHSVVIGARDAASNPAELQRTLQTDNHAPAPIADLSVTGGEGTRSTNSFDVRWSEPPGQAAPIVAAHLRLCDANGEPPCVTDRRAVASNALTGLSVPGRGDYALRVWLEDAAGNVDSTSVSNAVQLRFDDRTATRLTAGLTAKGGGVDARRTVGFGERPTVAGALSSERSQRLAGEEVVVLSRPRGSAGGFEREAVTVTDSEGHFRERIRRGPSRTLRFDYAGSPHQLPANASATVGVRAKSTIRVSRSRVRNGDHVRFSGRLAGGHVPPSGKLVELQAFYRSRWRAFAVVRSSGDGTWSHRYEFGGTRGTVEYPFRAVMEREEGYPYERGRSRVVRVKVLNR